MNSVVVGIGSNIDPYRHIDRAIAALARRHRLKKVSSLVVTTPVGYADQSDFVNGAALVETVLSAEAFTAELKEIERQLGRVRTGNKYGPRTIDLDIVVWNGAIVDDDYYEREFLRTAVKELTDSGP
jgi:2-amino-4-hydroxy-6-hydroxymethyldihydropteridine diphosphokinase